MLDHRTDGQVAGAGASNTGAKTTGDGRTGKQDRRPSLLHSQLDWLQVAWRLELGLGVRETIESALDGARAVGLDRAAVDLGELVAEFRELRPGKWVWRNADLRGVLDVAGRDGWTLQAEVRSVALSVWPLRNAIDALRTAADCMGRRTEERVRRVDLASDWRRWELELGEAQWVTQRASVCAWRTSEGTLESWALGRGDVQLVVYDKTRELLATGDCEKRAVLAMCWGPIPADERVTRIEVRFRSTPLGEMGVLTLDDLGDKLDGMWSYGTRWGRMVLPTHVERSRCALDPRWSALADAHFGHRWLRVDRRRVRGLVATTGRALGGLRSYLAATGTLSAILVADSEGVVLESARQVLESTLTEREAYDALANHWQAHGVALLPRFTEGRSAKEELATEVERTRAARARWEDSPVRRRTARAGDVLAYCRERSSALLEGEEERRYWRERARVRGTGKSVFELTRERQRARSAEHWGPSSGASVG